MSDTGLVETADPGEVFKALSDDTRVDILLALWDVEGSPVGRFASTLSAFEQFGDRLDERRILDSVFPRMEAHLVR